MIVPDHSRAPGTLDYISGYYQVGNECFSNKTSALMAASRSKIFPKWHFHSHVYQNMPWSTSTMMDLRQLYQSRARQLRDKYDWISLSFSGGADSFTALRAFVDSQTFLDEIFVRWPIKATVNRYKVSRDTCPENILSEWTLTVLPMLDQLKRHLSTQTKISVIDWSDRILSYEAIDTDWARNQDFFNPGVRIKYDTVTEHTQRAIDTGKRTAIVVGTDKPQVCVRDGQAYCYFIDKLAHNHPHAPYDQHSELFFWSPDCPDITVNQAKVIYQHMRSNPSIAELVDWSRPFEEKRKNIWDKVVRSLIYPDYSPEWFQARKPSTNIFSEVDAWLIKDHNSMGLMQSWRYVIKNHMKSIDPKFIEYRDGVPIGYVGFFDRMYHLGPIPTDC